MFAPSHVVGFKILITILIILLGGNLCQGKTSFTKCTLLHWIIRIPFHDQKISTPDGVEIFWRSSRDSVAFLLCENKGSAPSSRRRQQSPGLLHWIIRIPSAWTPYQKKEPPIRVVLSFGGAAGIRLHFRRAKIKVLLRQAVAGNSPPD